MRGGAVPFFYNREYSVQSRARPFDTAIFVLRVGFVLCHRLNSSALGVDGFARIVRVSHSVLKPMERVGIWCVRIREISRSRQECWGAILSIKYNSMRIVL